MKIDELIEKEENKSFFSKVKKIFRPRNLLLGASLLYAAFVPVACDNENKPKPNQPPVINNVNYNPGSAIDENSLLRLTVDVTDPNAGDIPVISISGNQFSKVSDTEFEWTPDYTEGEVGGKQYDFTITADDKKGGVDYALISVFVNDVNRAPVLDFISNITKYEGDLVRITANAVDPDNDPITYACNDVNFVKIGNSIFDWLTNVGDNGIYTVRISADDNKGGVDFQDISVYVRDESKIVFMSNRAGNYEIFAMNPDGTGQTNLTNNSAYDGRPVWSPDGSKIAFKSDRDGSYEVYVMDSDGSNVTRLTDNPAWDGRPSWSPNGTKIAFHSNRDGNFEVYVMDADGSNQTRLTDNPASDYIPAWSPDGSKIAFGSNRDGNYEVYVMNADGSNKTRLTDNPALDDYAAWSPDGSKIAFQSGRDGAWEVYVMDADGSNQTRITNHPANDAVPVWSPDGTKIAFGSDRDAVSEIYVMNADGSNIIRLTDNSANDSDADWK